MNRIKIDIPIVVEGKYDVIKLRSIIDGKIIKTDGYAIFNSEKDREFLKKIAEKNGLIVLTDSDGAGLLIRNHLNSFLPKEKVFHLYPPQIRGKEKRKSAPSKSGFLGVEGIPSSEIRRLFEPFENSSPSPEGKTITKLDLYEDGFIGKEGSAEKRDLLKKRLGLPGELSTNALLDALNLISSYDEYKSILNESEKGI